MNRAKRQHLIRCAEGAVDSVQRTRERCEQYDDERRMTTLAHWSRDFFASDFYGHAHRPLPRWSKK